MADILLDEQSVPSTPAAGGLIIYPDATASLPAFVNDGGRKGILAGLGSVHNASIAAQGAGFASDTWLVDSDLLIPSFGLQARTMFEWEVVASKTAAGTAAPIYHVRIGSARSTVDTARLSLTGPLQTAVADDGTLLVRVVVRSVGAAGVLQGSAWWMHTGTILSSTSGTGFANNTTGHVGAASAGFDNSALAGQYISLSLVGGASAAWTVSQVRAKAYY